MASITSRTAMMAKRMVGRLESGEESVRFGRTPFSVTIERGVDGVPLESVPLCPPPLPVLLSEKP